MERKDNMKTVRGIAKAGAILLRITQVFAIIGAAFCMIGMIVLAALPRELIRIQTDKGYTVNVDLRNQLSEEEWEEIEPYLNNAFKSEKDVKYYTIEDRYFAIRSTEDQTLERGDLALYLAPGIPVLALIWFFCGSLRKVLVNIRNGQEPFTEENAVHLRTCGILMLVGAVAPDAVEGIIGLFSDARMGFDVNFGLIFGGLMLLGLAALFKAEAAKRSETEAPAVPGPGGFSQPGQAGETLTSAPPLSAYPVNTPLPPQPPVPPRWQAPAPEQTPAPQEEPHDPNAF